MNTKDIEIVKFRRRSPRMLFSAYYNGMLLASGGNMLELGEGYARKYGTEWLLQDGKKFYSREGLVK